MQKVYLSANQLLLDSCQLAANIYKSSFRPDFIIGVWRGGTPVGIAVQEYLSYLGCKTDHIAIRSSSYYGIEQQHKTVNVHGLHYVVERLNRDSRLLIVDDVFDTGRSIEAIFQHLQNACNDNLPNEIRVACPWFKPTKNLTTRTPDFFLYKTDHWLVFPHELEGLDLEELRQGKPEIAAMLEASLAHNR